ncbi:MAG: hypothetical protein KC912_17715 [Proteobacteria bacterium]|nr:hypothetical protein [Pseudomonadota bacterium]
MSALLAVLMTLLMTLGIAAAVLGVLFVIVRTFRSHVLGEALMTTEGEVVLDESMAVSLGVESWGRTQLRGNVALVASREELVAVQWVPRRTLRIRRSDIVRIETPMSHLGASRATPLLKVVFRTAEGEDSVAFQLRDLETWVRELETVQEQAETPLLRSAPREAAPEAAPEASLEAASDRSSPRREDVKQG